MSKYLIQYTYSCTNAFFKYLKEHNIENLIKSLKEVEKHAMGEDDGENASLWFKFGEDDNLVSTIKSIKIDLELPKEHSNRKLLIEKMESIIGLNPSDELRVYYS